MTKQLDKAISDASYALSSIEAVCSYLVKNTTPKDASGAVLAIIDMMRGFANEAAQQLDAAQLRENGGAE